MREKKHTHKMNLEIVESKMVGFFFVHVTLWYISMNAMLKLFSWNEPGYKIVWVAK